MRHALWFVIAFAVVGCGGSSDADTTFDDADGGGGAGASSGTGGGGGIDGSAGGDSSAGSGGTGASDANNADLIGNPDGNGCGTTQCTDCLDNDGDGLIDSNDPDCTGPIDNDESSFATGIPGDNKDACKQDCFFDGNSGSGDDGCEWNVGCENPSPDPSCKPSASECSKQQVQACKDYCLPLVPNGCDCFGCCDFAYDGQPSCSIDADCPTNQRCIDGRCDVQVWLGSQSTSGSPSCNTAADLTDPTKCHPCYQVPSCLNTCEHCEICLNKPLPADCSQQTCNPGEQLCGQPGQAQCPEGYYCVTGCCKPTI